ncbi:MAG: chemotaxis receiver protein [Pseudomonadota bacterium]|jgi:two-component system chemotaxis response regulator CheY
MDNIKINSETSVLIIDDLVSARLLLADMMKDLGFKRCFQARDGEEGLHVMQSTPVQLVLCDFMMEGMNGLEFLQALRAENVAQVPPIIFVSSAGDLQSVERALTLGANDYLVKPVNFRKLRAKIERALNYQQVAYGA